LPLLIGYLLAKSRDPLSMINLSRSLVHDSWFIELVRLYMKFLACALKNKIKNKISSVGFKATNLRIMGHE